MRSLGYLVGLVLGAFFSILLDLKWLVLGFFFGGLAAWSCSAHASDISDEILQDIYLGGSRVIVFKEQGPCPAGQHWAWVHDVDVIDTGCAVVGKEGYLSIHWAHGGDFVIPRQPLGGWRPRYGDLHQREDLQS
jgi:hypothetical protein